jgi:hypothetical protein
MTYNKLLLQARVLPLADRLWLPLSSDYLFILNKTLQTTEKLGES